MIDAASKNINAELRLFYDKKILDLKESLCVENEVNCHIETEEKADEEGVYKDLGKWLQYTIKNQRQRLQKMETDFGKMMAQRDQLANEIRD